MARILQEIVAIFLSQKFTAAVLLHVRIFVVRVHVSRFTVTGVDRRYHADVATVLWMPRPFHAHHAHHFQFKL